MRASTSDLSLESRPMCSSMDNGCSRDRSRYSLVKASWESEFRLWKWIVSEDQSRGVERQIARQCRHTCACSRGAQSGRNVSPSSWYEKISAHISGGSSGVALCVSDVVDVEQELGVSTLSCTVSQTLPVSSESVCTSGNDALSASFAPTSIVEQISCNGLYNSMAGQLAYGSFIMA